MTRKTKPLQMTQELEEVQKEIDAGYAKGHELLQVKRRELDEDSVETKRADRTNLKYRNVAQFISPDEIEELKFTVNKAGDKYLSWAYIAELGNLETREERKTAIANWLNSDAKDSAKGLGMVIEAMRKPSGERRRVDQPYTVANRIVKQTQAYIKFVGGYDGTDYYPLTAPQRTAFLKSLNAANELITKLIKDVTESKKRCS